MTKLTWTGGQDAVQDVSGEYEAVDSFTYEAALLESVPLRTEFSMRPPANRIAAHLRIAAGGHRNLSGRPWSLSVRLYPVHIVVASGRSRRIGDAKRAAEAELAKQDFVRQALEKFYAIRIHVVTDKGEPVMTMFGYEDGYLLPYGSYVLQISEHSRYVYRYASGYTSGSGPHVFDSPL